MFSSAAENTLEPEMKIHCHQYTFVMLSGILQQFVRIQRDLCEARRSNKSDLFAINRIKPRLVQLHFQACMKIYSETNVRIFRIY